MNLAFKLIQRQNCFVPGNFLFYELMCDLREVSAWPGRHICEDKFHVFRLLRRLAIIFQLIHSGYIVPIFFSMG